MTEEIVPGFKFSRASYVLSLLRPQIMNELELKKHGLKVSFLLGQSLHSRSNIEFLGHFHPN